MRRNTHENQKEVRVEDNLPKEPEVERKPRNLTPEQEAEEEAQYRRRPPQDDQKPSPKSKP
jgi:hypothetical protein